MPTSHGLLLEPMPRVRVRRLPGVQPGKDLVRRTVNAVAQEQRPREKQRQEHPPGPPTKNRPDGYHSSHTARLITSLVSPYTPQGYMSILCSCTRRLSSGHAFGIEVCSGTLSFPA